jgi:hypothetical protein
MHRAPLLLALCLLFTACTSEDSGAPVTSVTSERPPSTSKVDPDPTSYDPYGFEVCEPERVSMPEWLPEDLPLLPGTYATVHEPRIKGYERTFFVIPGRHTVRRMTQLVRHGWQKAGYRLGRDDAEPGEFEAEFSKGIAKGAFKVRTSQCLPRYGTLYLIYAPEGPTE